MLSNNATFLVTYDCSQVPLICVISQNKKIYIFKKWYKTVLITKIVLEKWYKKPLKTAKKFFFNWGFETQPFKLSYL